MRKAVDEGGSSGVAQWCRGVSCFGSCEVGDESSGFLAPTASHFDAENDKAASGIAKEFGVGPFFGFAGIVECCCSKAAGPTAGFTGTGERGDQSGVDCQLSPTPRGKPFAMTSMRRSSMCWTCWTLRSASRVWVVTRAPASRHTLAAARSSGPPRLRSTPGWAQAARWSPRESKVRRHRQVRANSGRGSRSRRRRRKGGMGMRSRWCKGWL